MMMAGRQCMFICLCLLLASWSTESTLLSSKVSSHIKNVVAGKPAAIDDDQAQRSGNETDNADDKEDDDSDGDDDSNTDATTIASDTKKPPVALPPVAPVALPQLSKQPVYQLASAEGEEEQEEHEEPSFHPHAAEEKRLKKAVQTAVAALAKNQQQQEQLKHKIEYYSDSSKSNEEIDASAKLVANETESPAMASTLSQMWKEMRMFDVPFYTEHLDVEIQNLKRDQSVLKDKLKKANDKLRAAQKKWQGEDDAENDEQDNAVKKDGKEELKEKEEETHLSGGPTHMRAPSVENEFNFWKMNRQQKDSFLQGWIVYFVGGIALAFLHNKARVRNEKIFTPEPRRDVTRGVNDFSFSLFGCFGAPNICVMGCCCPCLAWSDTLDKSGLLSYWKAFLAFFLLTLLYGFTWGIAPMLVIALGTYHRQKLRQSYDMENGTVRSVAFDALAWLCCQPCAIIQEAREESVLLQEQDP